jgi:hypothetical protein
MIMPDKVAAWWEIANYAYDVKLDPWLVLGVVWQESSGEVGAYNPEQKYRWFWDCKNNKPFRKVTDEENRSEYPPKDFYDMRGFKGVDADQEWWAQQASWGVMQPMGAVARECGYRGIYLTQLVISPELNIQIGCTHLARKIKQENGNLEKGLLRYNGGGNKNYGREVLVKQQIIKKQLAI